MTAKCAVPAPALLIKGIDQFNAGDYFECHETLETLWMGEREPVRELYQGILQVGVAFYKQGQGQYAGAVGLLQRGISHLTPFAPFCHGVNVSRLIKESEQVCWELVRLGRHRIHQLDRTQLPQVHWAPGSLRKG